MKNVFVLRNRKISAYLDPFFKVEDKNSVKVGLTRYCILNLEAAKKDHFDEAELFYLGEYDDENCKLKLLDQPEFLCGFDDVFVNKSN